MYQLYYDSPVVTPTTLRIIEVAVPAPPGAAYYSDETFDTFAAAQEARDKIIAAALARWAQAGRQGSPFWAWGKAGRNSPPPWVQKYGFQMVLVDESDQYFTVAAA